MLVRWQFLPRQPFVGTNGFNIPSFNPSSGQLLLKFNVGSAKRWTTFLVKQAIFNELNFEAVGQPKPLKQLAFKIMGIVIPQTSTAKLPTHTDM